MYAIEAGACAGGKPGLAHVLDQSLEEIRIITFGGAHRGAPWFRSRRSQHRGRSIFPGMGLVTTPAIVLSSLRYSETSKIVRLATRDHGVQSAIAKGALRPQSRFGAALQLLSEGQAQFLTKEHRELHLLTAFDLPPAHRARRPTWTAMPRPRPWRR